MGDIIERNYRQPIYRNFSNYRQIIDIENWIQFYSINTIESIVLKTRKVPKLLVARDFCCSKANTDDGARYKSVVTGTTRGHVKQNVKMCGGFAVDENIVEYSAFGLTGV